MTVILSYPSLHVHYLTTFIFLQKTLVHCYDIIQDKEGLSNRRKEGGLHRPTRRQSECPPNHQEALEPPPRWGQAYLEPEQVLLPRSCQGHSTPTLPMYYSAPSQGQLVLLAALTR